VSDKLHIRNASASGDSAEMDSLREIISAWRAALAPWLNANPENIPEAQSQIITAAALFAGMTVGHMIVIETLKEQDKRRVGALVQTNFRNGILMGKSEAQKAVLSQMPAAGTA